MNNSETFTKVLEINYANFEKIEVYFSFIGSGSAKIIKNQMIGYYYQKALIEGIYQ